MSINTLFWLHPVLLRQILLFTCAAALILTVAPFLSAGFSRIALCRWLLLAVFLFLLFKAGFVRHDSDGGGHGAIACTGLFLCVFIIPLMQPISGRKRLVAAVALMALILAASWRIQPGLLKASNPLLVFDRIVRMYSTLGHNLNNPASLPQQFAAKRETIHATAPLPNLPGTSDIYSYNQGLLFSSDNVWNPRPVFQSYSAYDKNLANINREHLLSDNAPDNIFFTIQPIDHRLPALEDGASWPILWRRYQINGEIGPFLILRRQAAAIATATVNEQKISGRLRQTVNIADSSRPIFATVSIQPTFLGKMLNLFFKPPELAITLQTSDGAFHKHRFIRRMGEAPFLLSPFIADTGDFAKIARFARNPGLSDNGATPFATVKRFWISPVGGKWADIAWQKDITVTISTSATAPLAEMRPAEAPVATTAVASLARFGETPGFIDELSLEADEGGPMRLQTRGWAVDEKARQSPAAFFLRIGNQRFFLSAAQNRPDLITALGEPKYGQSGFSGAVLLDEVPDGDHTIIIEVINQAKTGVYELERFSSKKLKPGAILRKKGDAAELVFKKASIE
ncbi:MAG: hypothetical protein LBU39_00870 [Desulfobulbaceae bacterium]|jgi:hypothetical protein|nr:hypothetical protein [Desulfobulbaceae bacterium]